MEPGQALSLVAIGAHMDDCWLGAGATCLKAARQGHRVTFITAVGDYRDLWYVKGREGEIHPRLEKIAQEHGIRQVILEHRYMRLVNGPELVGEISGILKELRADILFCHSEDESNQDHTALGAASRIAALHGECFVEGNDDTIKLPTEVYQYTTGWQASDFRPNYFVDVTQTLLDTLAICNQFDEIYANGRWATKKMTVVDHEQRDRSVGVASHARHKLGQAMVFAVSSGYAEGFYAYTRQAMTHRKLGRI